MSGIESRPNDSPVVTFREKIEVEIMKATGLDDKQIARLALLKQRIGAMEVDELTIEHKRMTFLKYLHEDCEELYKKGVISERYFGGVNDGVKPAINIPS